MLPAVVIGCRCRDRRPNYSRKPGLGSHLSGDAYSQFRLRKYQIIPAAIASITTQING